MLRGPVGAARAAGNARGAAPRDACLHATLLGRVFRAGSGAGGPAALRPPRRRDRRRPLTMAAGLWALLLLPVAAAVYEDQVGKFDW